MQRVLLKCQDMEYAKALRETQAVYQYAACKRSTSRDCAKDEHMTVESWRSQRNQNKKDTIRHLTSVTDMILELSAYYLRIYRLSERACSHSKCGNSNLVGYSKRFNIELKFMGSCWFRVRGDPEIR